MAAILLTILKILGILLLLVIGLALLLLLLVLFVPVRYRLKVHRDLKEAEEKPVVAAIRATWLLHLIQVCFTYPDAAYVNVKVFGFGVMRRLGREKKEKKTAPKEEDGQKNAVAKEEAKRKEPDHEEQKTIEYKTEENKTEQLHSMEEGMKKQKEKAETEEPEPETKESPRLSVFFKKLLEKIKNIQYTIHQIYDKINHIVKNLKYYLEILQGDPFKNAFSLCSAQIFDLLKSIRPRKIKGQLLIGTGDPASTGQVMAIYGILYPFLGEQVDVTPDFEQKVIEGELIVKGKITVCKALKVALVIFFNKDIRKVITLLKREAL